MRNNFLMPAIVTITFNPAIDKSTSVNALVPDKKLHCAAPALEPGGGGINIARGIRKLGGEATAIYLGGGYNSQLMQRLLMREQVPSLICPIRNDTRENFILSDETTHLQYRFGMPGPEVSSLEWKSCLRLVEEFPEIDYLVASGSLPPGLPADMFSRLAAIAKRRQAKFIADTSGEALQMLRGQDVFLLKPNIGELACLAGKQELCPSEVIDVAQQVIRDGTARILVVSMGALGAMLITLDEILRFVPPPVKVKSTVGAGDCLLAGIVWRIATGHTLRQAVQYGVACGTAATMNAGTALFRIEDVMKLYKLMQDKEQTEGTMGSHG